MLRLSRATECKVKSPAQHDQAKLRLLATRRDYLGRARTTSGVDESRFVMRYG